ncbi:MAG: Ig-like domain-containing protein [Chloroflexi bacterium]|nr:Ig-like domain-containing protein [Chloroflexota bacterium]
MRRTLIGLVAGIVIGITVVSMSGIGRAADGDAGSQNPLTSWIPDIKQIMSDAMQDVFISASTDIQDPEIANFYEKLTGNVMTNIEVEKAATYTGPVIAYPLIRIVTPAYNSTVSGSVLVRVDAVDDFDPMGTLSVEILVDGTMTITAHYVPLSGYYEAIWDSMQVPSGTMHTIMARATDSGGSSQTTLSVVFVE